MRKGNGIKMSELTGYKPPYLWMEEALQRRQQQTRDVQRQHKEEKNEKRKREKDT